MYASNIVSDAAVFARQHPRAGDLRPGDQRPAEGRKARLIASLRGFLAAHTPAQHESARAR